jgi:hypothetical protein
LIGKPTALLARNGQYEEIAERRVWFVSSIGRSNSHGKADYQNPELRDRDADLKKNQRPVMAQTV